MRRRFSIRATILVALATLSFALTGLDALHSWVTSWRAVEELSLRRASSVGFRAMPALERSSLEGDATAVEEAVVGMSVVPNVTVALVCDGDGHILHATDFTLRGRLLGEALGPQAQQLVDRVARVPSPPSQLTADGTGVQAAFPFRLGMVQGELRPSRMGTLYLQLELGSQKREALRTMGERALMMGVLAVLGCLAVWIFLELAFARPLQALERAVRDYAAGKGELHAPAGGGRELDQIGSVLEQMARDLTSQNADLHESEEKFARLFRDAPVAMTLSDLETGEFLEMNDEAQRLTGHLRQEVVGKTSLEVGWIGAEDRARIISSAREHGRITNLDLVVRAKDGRRLDCVYTGIALSAGGRIRVLGITQDVSERKRAEQALRDSEARFRAVVDSSHEGILFADAKAIIQYRSPSYARINGYRDDERLGHIGFETIHPDDKERVRGAWIEMLEHPGEVQEVAYRSLHKDGGWRHVASSFHNLLYNPSVRSVVISTRDLTERRRAEDEQHRLEALLIQAQRMEAVGQLAGGVAHDFNNILSAIMLQSNLLTQDLRLPADARVGIAEIEAAARRAADLTRQLLTFSRRQVMRPSQLDLNVVVGNLLRMLRRLIGEHITLDFSPGPGDLWLEADAGMIEQVITNLVVNARDAMTDGGKLGIRTARLVLGDDARARHPDARPGSFVGLSVSDTGVGMDAETASHIYEPFFTTKPQGQGTGLGLATVYGVVQQHHGWIELDSSPGAGTTFTVVLPAQPRPAETVHRTAAPEILVGGSECILVVEDEPALRAIMARSLSSLGYRVLEATSGAEALEQWSVHREAVDLLVSDMVMPGGLSGLELAERLVADKPSLKIILTSGYSPGLGDSDLLRRRGASYLPKPLTVQRLALAVRQALDEA